MFSLKRGFLVLLACMAAALFVVAIATVSTSQGRFFRMHRGLLVGGVAVIGLTAVGGVYVWQRRTRRKAQYDMIDFAGEYGLAYRDQAEAMLLHPYLAAPPIRGDATITRVFQGCFLDRSVLVLQQTHHVSYGHGSVPVHATVLILDDLDWPTMWIEPRRGIGKWLRAARRPDEIPFEDAGFLRDFRVATEDEDFAILLLTPEVQHFMDQDRASAWYSVNGSLVLVTKGELDAVKGRLLMKRVEELFDLIPDELHVHPDVESA